MAVLKQRTSSIATAVFVVAIAHGTASLLYFTALQWQSVARDVEAMKHWLEKKKDINPNFQSWYKQLINESHWEIKGKRLISHCKCELKGLNHILSSFVAATHTCSCAQTSVLCCGARVSVQLSDRSSSVLAQLTTWAKAPGADVPGHSSTAGQLGIFNLEVEAKMFVLCMWSYSPSSSTPAGCVGQWYPVPMQTPRIFLKVSLVVGLSSLKTIFKSIWNVLQKPVVFILTPFILSPLIMIISIILNLCSETLSDGQTQKVLMWMPKPERMYQWREREMT